MTGVWIAAGVVVGCALRGDWGFIMGAFMGFATGGMFYERMIERIRERNARTKR